MATKGKEKEKLRQSVLNFGANPARETVESTDTPRDDAASTSVSVQNVVQAQVTPVAQAQVAQLASATTSTPAPDLVASSSSSPIHGFHEANQPKIEFPKDAKTPHRAFRLACCKEFHWLHYPSVEENKVFCFECCKVKELHLGFTRDNFTEKGHSDWTNALNTSESTSKATSTAMPSSSCAPKTGRSLTCWSRSWSRSSKKPEPRWF